MFSILAEWVGMWLHQPPDPEGYRLQQSLRGLFAHIADPVIAAVNITQVFMMRPGVLTLAIAVTASTFKKHL